VPARGFLANVSSCCPAGGWPLRAWAHTPTPMGMGRYSIDCVEYAGCGWVPRGGGGGGGRGGGGGGGGHTPFVPPPTAKLCHPYLCNKFPALPQRPNPFPPKQAGNICSPSAPPETSPDLGEHGEHALTCPNTLPVPHPERPPPHGGRRGRSQTPCSQRCRQQPNTEHRCSGNISESTRTDHITAGQRLVPASRVQLPSDPPPASPVPPTHS
jgi:hypothetical protein